MLSVNMLSMQENCFVEVECVGIDISGNRPCVRTSSSNLDTFVFI